MRSTFQVCLFAVLAACGGGGGRASPTYTFGGSASGLLGSGLELRLRIDTCVADFCFYDAVFDLAVLTNGPFTFPASHDSGILTGSTFIVTVLTQPVDPNQTCVVSNGVGTLAKSNVNDILVSCVASNTAGGSLPGRSGSGLKSATGGVDDRSIATIESGEIAIDPANGAAYNVVISSHPTNRCRAYAFTDGTHNGVAITTNITTVEGVTIGGAAYVVNAASGNNSGDGIDYRAGSLTLTARSPLASGAHLLFVTVDASGKFAYVADLHSRDVAAYAMDSATGSLTPAPGTPFAVGLGLIAVSIDQTGDVAYIIDGWDKQKNSALSIAEASGTLNSVLWDRAPVGTGRVPIAIDRLEQFAVVPNPDFATVSSYRIEGYATCALTPVVGSPFPAGANPSFAAITQDGRFAYVVNTHDGTISGYVVDTDGVLAPVPGSPFSTARAPDSIAIDPTGQFAYVPSYASDELFAFKIDSSTGALAPVPGSPFARAKTRIAVVVSE